MHLQNIGRHWYIPVLLIGFVTPLAHAQEVLPFATYYNPASGFVSAQPDFTKVFLQMAGSLEHHGTPEPYIRHVLSEHTRIAAKYKAATGQDSNSRPAYLTDAYVDNLLANWNKLEASLKLDDLSRRTGRNMRLAIMGSWNMAEAELVAQEAGLTPQQAAAYRQLIRKPYFRKADLAAVNAFYEGPYDRLTDLGKGQISRRTWRGTMPPREREAAIANDRNGSLVVALLNSHHKAYVEYLTTDSTVAVNGDTLIAALKSELKLDHADVSLTGLDEYHRDAYQYSHAIKADFEARFAFVDQNASSAQDAKNMKAALVSMVENLAVLGNSEFRAALVELRAE